MLIRKVRGTADYTHWTEFVEDRPFNDQWHYIRNGKHKELGWRVTVPSEQGLDGLVELST